MSFPERLWNVDELKYKVILNGNTLVQYRYTKNYFSTVTNYIYFLTVHHCACVTVTMETVKFNFHLPQNVTGSSGDTYSTLNPATMSSDYDTLRVSLERC